MTVKTSFDAAISVASEDSWIARDLHDLLIEAGHTVYFYGTYTDLARGHLRKVLYPIYAESAINVMLWSAAYAKKVNDQTSVISQEFYYLWDRSVGIVSIRRFALERIKQVWSGKDGFLHPDGSEGVRSRCVPCRFQVAPHYKTDRLHRWQTLGDIEVTPQGTPTDSGIITYLIPSGAVPAFLRHSNRIRHDADCRALKQSVGEEFAQLSGSSELMGARFLMDVRGMEFPHVYCSLYDNALIEYWDRTAR
jgi:hypothetical protein